MIKIIPTIRSKSMPAYHRMHALIMAAKKSHRAKKINPKLNWGSLRVIRIPSTNKNATMRSPADLDSREFGVVCFGGNYPYTAHVLLHEIFHRINQSSTNYRYVRLCKYWEDTNFIRKLNPVWVYRRSTAEIWEEVFASAASLHILRKMGAPAEELKMAKDDHRKAIDSYKRTRLRSVINSSIPLAVLVACVVRFISMVG